MEVKPETGTLASITYQNFFKLFKKLSGMTGTAKTEEEEFGKIYNLPVVTIPTHLPMIRNDKIDAIFLSRRAKFKMLVDEIKKYHQG